jgi:hypothetical protein
MTMDEPATSTAGLSCEEFCARFKARMLAVAGPAWSAEADGQSLEDYADQTAPTYYDDPDMRDDGPEDCADCDMSYW